MSARVIDLLPGDLVTNPVGSAVYVAQAVHPIWPALQLVVWRLSDGTWSHDALAPGQYVGRVARSDAAERESRLRSALLSGGST